MTDITPWRQRCERFDDGHITTTNDIQMVMQEEINELRAENDRLKIERDDAIADYLHRHKEIEQLQRELAATTAANKAHALLNERLLEQLSRNSVLILSQAGENERLRAALKETTP
jgi:hypothetical protein